MRPSNEREVLRDERCFTDALDARRRSFSWLTRCNTKRRHSGCGYPSPNTYENAFTTTTLAAAA